MNWSKPFSDSANIVMGMGSMTAALAILWIATKVTMAAIDYGLLFLVGVRIVVTFLMIHFIRSGVEGFDKIDLKEMHDSIPLLILPALTIAGCNWKFDMCVTVPISTVFIIIATQMSFAQVDDNMDCYVNPD